jgi:pyruvate formate lyase activating enzyme
VNATILNLQRMSTEDGPGIRTTVFFKGCPLACGWCHNPESIAPGPRTVWHPRACLGCGACARVCPRGALAETSEAGAAGGVRPDPARCRACGACARECPAAALEVLGAAWTPEALAAELARDQAYFEESGGGVTASGGEPLLWPGFVAELFRLLRARGIACALDTCGHASPEALSRVAAEAGLVLLDLKLWDPEEHRRHTGQDNRLVLDNARRLARGLRPDQRLWIRTPLVPGVTARADNLTGLGRFLATELGPAVERWELLAFNNLCRDQYVRLGRTWEYAGTPLMTAAELERCAELARAAGVPPERVRPTGPTRVE